jgi:hypothetical protein
MPIIFAVKTILGFLFLIAKYVSWNIEDQACSVLNPQKQAHYMSETAASENAT